MKASGPTTCVVGPLVEFPVHPGGFFRAVPDPPSNEVPIGGGSVTTLASGQAQAFSLAVAGTHVVWSNRGSYSSPTGTVNEVPVGGGSVTTLASGVSYGPLLAVDGTHVYWGGLGVVEEVPVDGGTVRIVVRDQTSSLAVGAPS